MVAAELVRGSKHRAVDYEMERMIVADSIGFGWTVVAVGIAVEMVENCEFEMVRSIEVAGN